MEPWEKVAVMCPHVIWIKAARSFGCGIPAVTCTNRMRLDPLSATTESIGRGNARVRSLSAVSPERGTVIGSRLAMSNPLRAAKSCQRHPANPIIIPGSDSAWDADAIYKPSVVHKPDRWLR